MSSRAPRRALLVVCVALLVAPAVSRAGEPVKDARANAQRDATAMSKAFLAGDFETFANYAYPNMVKLAGGRKKLIDTLKKGMAEMKGEGFRFLSSTVGPPTELVKAGNELHAILPQQQVIEVAAKHGELHGMGHLIGVSSDSGKTWTFIDAAGATPETIRQVLPSYNPKLKVPPRTQPTFVPK
jgi:hypothetical protein